MIGFGQLTYVPDNWFEAYLENNGMGNGIQYDDSVFTAAIDTVIYLDLSYGAGQAIGVFDLTGIEDFTNLEYLDCSYNLLTSIDLSQNIALTYLNCSYNQLTSLDVSSNTALIYLNCWDNNLTTLNVNNNTSLDTLECGKNQLTSLDVSQNTNLIFLRCFINQLTYLDVNQNTNLNVLRCANNQLTTLDVSQNTALTWLSCDMNGLTSLDLDQNTSLVKLQCFSNQLTTLDLSQNTALTYLRCYNNQLTSLDMRNGNNINVIDFKTINNPNLTCIDVDDSTWSFNNWTVANGVLCYLDPQHYYSNNCNPIYGCTDILACNYDTLADTDDGSCIYSTASHDTVVSNISISWNSLILTTSGDYTVTLFNSVGCDSIAHLNLTITNPSWILNFDNTEKTLIRVIDILGKEMPYKKRTPLFYIYNDGTVEKKIIIE